MPLEASLEQVYPDREEGFRHAGCLNEAQLRRYRQAQARRRHRIFGIAATRQQGADRSADQVRRDVLSRSNGDPGCLQPENVGGARRWRISAQPLDNVGPVHSGRGDPDQDLVRAWHRHRPLDDPENVGAARIGRDDGTHGGGKAITHGAAY
jgi:hypothetical protein